MNGEWILETLQRPLKIVLPKYNFGILEYYVKPSPSVEIFVPSMLCRTVNGIEVILMVFQLTDMSEEKFAEDDELVDWGRFEKFEKYHGGELKQISSE